MKFGENLRKQLNSLKAMAVMAPAMLLGGAAAAQETEAASGYTPLGPDMIKGQPEPGALGLQPQFSEVGNAALPLHHGLVYVMGVISVIVLGLLLYVMWRFRAGKNPVPSKTSHNTVLEVIWTGIPIVILLAIALPSLKLIATQYEAPPKDAITVKAIGYQWYWGYEYPDLGVGEIVSNMLPEEQAKAAGEPSHLAVDNRLVLPVGVPIRLQTTAADVIHSFAVPSLWFKLDAVPGRLNEKMLKITEPGIYYGQCSELCGVRHGYMPIAVEAVPMDQFKAWVALQGGHMPGEEAAAAPAADAAPADAAEAAPAV